MNKNLILIIASAIFFICCQAQPALQKTEFPNNKAIKFRIITTPIKLLDSNRIEPSQTLVEVYIDQNIKSGFEKLSYEDWIKLLSDENTDWAANLFLYDFYKRDASYLEVRKGRKFWKRCCKESEVVFWKKKLQRD